jgi:hypothetical protein
MSMLSFPISLSLSHTYVCPNQYFSLSLSLTRLPQSILSLTRLPIFKAQALGSLSCTTPQPPLPLFSLSPSPPYLQALGFPLFRRFLFPKLTTFSLINLYLTFSTKKIHMLNRSVLVSVMTTKRTEKYWIQ